MTEKNDFSFSSNCPQRLTLGKCRIRAERHVTGGISCRTAYIHDLQVKGHPKKIFKKIKKNKQKKYFFQKKTLAERHVTLFGSRRTVMNWTSPDLYINLEKKKFEKKLKNDRKKWFFFFLQLLSALNLGKMPNPCRTACYRWNIVPNRIYSWSPSQGASEKNILKNKKK